MFNQRLRSEFCISCMAAIDTKAESRISTAWDWIKFVDLKMDQIEKIDPSARSEKEKEFWEVCFRTFRGRKHFLGIPITERRLKEIETRVTRSLKIQYLSF